MTEQKKQMPRGVRATLFALAGAVIMIPVEMAYCCIMIMVWIFLNLLALESGNTKAYFGEILYVVMVILGVIIYLVGGDWSGNDWMEDKISKKTDLKLDFVVRDAIIFTVQM